MLDQVSDRSGKHFLIKRIPLILGLITIQHLGLFDHGCG
jgi:hypothetical protein